MYTQVSPMSKVTLKKDYIKKFCRHCSRACSKTKNHSLNANAIIAYTAYHTRLAGITHCYMPNKLGIEHDYTWLLDSSNSLFSSYTFKKIDNSVIYLCKINKFRNERAYQHDGKHTEKRVHRKVLF